MVIPDLFDDLPAKAGSRQWAAVVSASRLRAPRHGGQAEIPERYK